MTLQPIPSFSDIEAAAKRLEGYAVRTPLIESPALNAAIGGRILIKAETLQRTGSFKFRGAWNRISQLERTRHRAGVVAYSSGNHAQGVAAAAALRELPAVIVMPSDTPAIKQENTKRYGASVVLYDRAIQSREEIARRLATERGAILVPPFEDTQVIAGQGTAGLEIAAQARALGADIDAVLVGVSGGGLIGGIALALEQLMPRAAIYAVEPQGFDDYGRSLKAGARLRNAETTGNICDALLTPQPGETTFEINRRRVKAGLAVDEQEVGRAMRFAFETLKLVVEPGGAVALAAVLSGKFDARDKTVVVVLSGGNVDPALFARLAID